MLTNTLLAVVPRTVEGGPNVAIVMIVCNIVAIAFGKLTIKQPSAAPAMPSSAMFGGFGLPAVIGTACLGTLTLRQFIRFSWMKCALVMMGQFTDIQNQAQPRQNRTDR